MKWVTCHKCADYALVDDEDEPAAVHEDEDDLRTERRMRDAVEHGNAPTLLYFIAHCFSNGLAVPEWARERFLAATRKGSEIKSCDEVFGRPLKKGKQLKAARRRAQLAEPIWSRVCERHSAGEAIDKGLFDSVGKEFDVGGTVAAEIYYDFEKEFKERFG
jgi:hypothetical protein